MHLHIHAEKDIVRILFAFYSLSQEQKRIRARLAATSAGTNHLACLTRVVIGEATASSWRECLDVDNTFP